MLKSVDRQRIEQFRREVWAYYQVHGRHDLLWRGPVENDTIDPYRILVSEIMLQQTQAARVTPKFEAFMRQFPSAAVLSTAPLADVLVSWSGLGYNRRAKFLWQAAQAVVARPDSTFPDSLSELIKLPGVGINTAGAIMAYAYNRPVVFIETNIRTVFIHHFFSDIEAVPDRDIADLVARAVPDNPREWYWALMDYGTHLKQTVGNRSRSSAHYKKQSPFQGSRRQIRGQILKLLGTDGRTAQQLMEAVHDERCKAVLADLVLEGLLTRKGDHYTLPRS